ncbi:MAG TPA: cell surface protein SprA [Gemmatimonadales bacterium]|nr:cell surface protein SprA [Gemmatimonadales bacterium]
MARLAVALGVLCFVLPAVASAQDSPGAPGVHVSFNVALPTLQQPPEARAAWLGAPSVTPAQAGARWERALDVRLSRERAAAASTSLLAAIYGANNLEVQYANAAVEDRKSILGIPSKYADLRIDGSVFLELRSDRLRNLTCTPAQLLDQNSGCRGGFKAPRLDNEFNAKVGGLIGSRLHVNVDYDSRREFNANNDIQVYYQGLQDEILQRVEVGTVSFRTPPSRFLTAAIPANNFGINTTLEFGAFTLQGMMATQEGSVVGQRVYTVGATTSEPQDRIVRDIDFESGRFFWAVDPVTLPNYPFVDILNLDAVAIPAAVQPADAQVRVYRYRTGVGSGLNPNLGGITATGFRPDGPERVEGTWQLLLQGTDYYLDPSATWFALAARLDQNDYLAVSYVTVNGTRVGTFPSAENPAVTDSLLLVAIPNQGPTQQTFRHEMRQVYRVSGTDLEKPSLRVTVTLNQSERPSSTDAQTYLAFFGLAIPPDPNIFDIENRLFPRTRDPGADLVLRESYIAYPTLKPFIDPRLQPNERADSVYNSPVYLLLTPQGPPSRFQMRLQYEAAGGTDAGSLNLNALQIRRGSEQLIAGGRVLRRGVDYEINYDLGQVTFNDPTGLFPAGVGTVTARFEERGIFAVAPTSILGGTLGYSLGDVGSVNLVAMYQKEQSVFTRPTLGFEPTSNLLTGITTDLRFQVDGVTRFFDKLTSQQVTAPSRVDVRAEYGTTHPDPNVAGLAYLEDFEGESAIPVSLLNSRWEYGSVPQSSVGVEGLGFSAGFDSLWAVQLSWQNLVPACNGCGPIELYPQDIDPTIITNGQGSVNETVLYLTFHADTAGGMVQQDNRSLWSQPAQPFTPRWRSLVTPLSQSGLDLSRAEYLEFWVFQGGEKSVDAAGMQLVVDLGSVSEDALSVTPESLTVVGPDSLYRGRHYDGVGLLNSERQSTGIFNASSDDIGILLDRVDSLYVNGVVVSSVPTCTEVLSGSVPVYPWGDLGSRCTNGNGFLDTEDLNGDNRLNAQGANDNVLRWVIQPNQLSQYYVRTGATSTNQQGETSSWTLYRVPIRLPEATIGTPNLRLIQSMRVTLVAPDMGEPDVVARFALARMRFIGAPWVRRADTPLLGIGGSTASPTGTMFAAVISTEDVALGYTSPPGVTNEAARNDNGQSVQGIQINEHSLRIVATELEAGERAEAYQRFPSGPQNVLKYEQIRAWFRGNGAGWESGDLQAFFKIGSDDKNWYMYLQPASSTAWTPEARISIPVWRQLRAQIEQRWLQGLPPDGAAACGIGDPAAYVACQGNYVVQVADPGVNPPNLAAAQELAAGIYRVQNTEVLGTVELWVDDIRLDNPLTQSGSSMALDARLAAADVADFSVNYVRQDGLFQQIGRDPTYRTTGALVLGTTFRVDRFLPASLGLSIPMSITHNRTTADPILIGGTDILAADIADLRQPSSGLTQFNIAIRRTKRGTTMLERGLLDPLTFNAALTSGQTQTELSSSTSSASLFNLSYILQLPRTGPSLSLGGAVDGLPSWVARSEGLTAARTTRISVVPGTIRLGSQLTRAESDFTGYLVPVLRPGDAALRPAVSLTNLWRNSAGLTWQPIGLLTFNTDLSSTRDLREYDDTTSIGRLANVSRKEFLGLDVGVERDRTLITAIDITPRLTSWMRGRFNTGSSFVLSRSLTSRAPIQEYGDTGTYILPQTLNNFRSREIGITLDPPRGFRQLLKDSSITTRALLGLRVIDFAYRTTLSSTYDLATFSPDLGYMLARGGLNDFLTQDADSALSAVETSTLTMGGGADLPLGISASLQYSSSNSDRYSRASNSYLKTEITQKEWPIVQARWTRTLRSGVFTVVSLSTNLRKRSGQTVLPSSAASALSLTSSSTWSNDLQLTFRKGISLSLGYGVSNNERQSNGTTTLGTGEDLTANLSYLFRLPGNISSARKQVRLSINALSSTAESCLDLPDESECITISDTRRKTLRAGVDTDLLSILTGGFQAAYVLNDVRQLNRKTEQLTLSLTFQLSLFSGDY